MQNNVPPQDSNRIIFRPAFKFDSTLPAQSPIDRGILLGVLLGMLLPTVWAWISVLIPTGPPPGVLLILMLALPTLWERLVLRYRPQRPDSRFAGLAPGIAFGATVSLVAFIAYQVWFTTSVLPNVHAIPRPLGKAILSEPIVLSPQHLLATLIVILVASLFCVMYALLEEYYWRRFVFGQLRRLTSVPTAILISSLGFASCYLPLLTFFFGWKSPATWLFALAFTGSGAFWAWLYDRNRSLIGPWLSHTMINITLCIIGSYTMHGLMLRAIHQILDMPLNAR